MCASLELPLCGFRIQSTASAADSIGGSLKKPTFMSGQTFLRIPITPDDLIVNPIYLTSSLWPSFSSSSASFSEPTLCDFIKLVSVYVVVVLVCQFSCAEVDN